MIFSANKRNISREKITSIIQQEIKRENKDLKEIYVDSNLRDFFSDEKIIEMKNKIFRSISTGLNINVSCPRIPETDTNIAEIPETTISAFVNEVIFAIENPQAPKRRS